MHALFIVTGVASVLTNTVSRNMLARELSTTLTGDFMFDAPMKEYNLHTVLKFAACNTEILYSKLFIKPCHIKTGHNNTDRACNCIWICIDLEVSKAMEKIIGALEAMGIELRK